MRTFCLYYGSDAAKLANGWRPQRDCPGVNNANDHAHISQGTLDRMPQTLRLIDQERRIVAVAAAGEVMP